MVLIDFSAAKIIFFFYSLADNADLADFFFIFLKIIFQILAKASCRFRRYGMISGTRVFKVPYDLKASNAATICVICSL